MGNERTAQIIPLSKKKILYISFLAFGFVAAGVFLFSILDQVPRYNTIVVRVLLIVSTFLFGLALLYSLYKLFDNSPGLILNAQGIHDNSSALTSGVIPWREITGIKVTKVSGQSFITIQVRYPERFLNKGHYLKKLFMKANLKFYGSPVQITATPPCRWSSTSCLPSLRSISSGTEIAEAV